MTIKHIIVIFQSLSVKFLGLKLEVYVFEYMLETYPLPGVWLGPFVKGEEGTWLLWILSRKGKLLLFIFTTLASTILTFP